MNTTHSKSTEARIERHGSVSSTNDLARTRGLEAAPDGTTVVAEAQCAGRGRRGRSWQSPPGVNLYVSQVVRSEPTQASLIPLLGAVATRQAVAAELGPDLQVVIKWPSDLLVQGAKLAGVLAEWVDGEQPFAILGIGINVNATLAELPENPRWPATSMGLLTGRHHDREALLSHLLKALRLWRDRIEQGSDCLVEEVRSHCISLGRRVRVSEPHRQAFEGTAVRVDRDGVLVVETGGRQQRVVTGDVDLLDREPG